MPRNNRRGRTGGARRSAPTLWGWDGRASRSVPRQLSPPGAKDEHDLIRRSNDTEGSPASIWAMRDWLDGRRVARSACVRFRRRRRSRRPVASLPSRSRYATSPALSRRDSRAVPDLLALGLQASSLLVTRGVEG